MLKNLLTQVYKKLYFSSVRKIHWFRFIRYMKLIKANTNMGNIKIGSGSLILIKI